MVMGLMQLNASAPRNGDSLRLTYIVYSDIFLIRTYAAKGSRNEESRQGRYEAAKLIKKALPEMHIDERDQ